MKKKHLLQALLLFLSLSVYAQTKWENIKLDERMMIKFPSMPEKKNGNGTISFVTKTNDSVTFTATVLDYEVIAKIDSVGLAAIKDTQPFADQLRLAIVKQRADYMLGDIIIDKWHTYTTYEILGEKRNDNKKLHLKMVVIGSKIYGLSCLIPAQLSTKDSAVFFNSFAFVKL